MKNEETNEDAKAVRIFIINTGNTSTKIGYFTGETEQWKESIPHSEDELAQFETLTDQTDFRMEKILERMEAKKIPEIDAVAARGGLLRPLESGTYRVTPALENDLIQGKRGMHASHLSALIGSAIARRHGVPCYVVDPVSVDEYWNLARYSGHPQFTRTALSHALNMKATARRFAEDQKKDYHTLTIITVHLGSGISVSIHHKGRMVDGIDGSQEGCFSVDRCGGLPVRDIAKYLFENKLSHKEFSTMVFGKGGLSAYVNSKDFRLIAAEYQKGNKEYIGPVDAMVYQIAKEVGALSTTVKGAVDGVVITGGMAHEEFLFKAIQGRVEFIAPVFCYPGEDEIEALAAGVRRILLGLEAEKTY